MLLGEARNCVNASSVAMKRRLMQTDTMISRDKEKMPTDNHYVHGDTLSSVASIVAGRRAVTKFLDGTTKTP